MDRSVAQGRPADPTADPADHVPDDRPVVRWLVLGVPAVLVLVAVDSAPFALVLVALGFERIAIRRRYGMLLAMTLIVTFLVVNAWGVLWSRILGW